LVCRRDPAFAEYRLSGVKPYISWRFAKFRLAEPDRLREKMIWTRNPPDLDSPNFMRYRMNLPRVNFTTAPELRKLRGKDYHVLVIDRVIAILDELASEPHEKGDVDLAERLGLHKSTVHRLLAVMHRCGLVERKRGAAKYRLGWHLFELGVAAAPRLELLDRARPFVAELVRRTGETADFGVLLRGEVLSLVSVESRYTARTPATIGRRLPIHCTSQGKAILAFSDREQLQRQLRTCEFTKYTRNTITTQERFLAELALVASRGYAVDNEEFEDGLRCVAAPVRNTWGM
jgi:IclR family KDG regulon transcriptional repressor